MVSGISADFESVRLTCIQIEETLSGKLGWIQEDEDKTWFLPLINLIRQYAVMAIDLTNTDIYLVPLRNIFCTVQMFDWKDLVGPFKDWLVICQFVDDFFFTDLIVNIDFQPDSTKPVFLSSLSSLNSSKKVCHPLMHVPVGSLLQRS